MLNTYFKSTTYIKLLEVFDFLFFVVTKEYLEHSDVDEVLVSNNFVCNFLSTNVL